LVTPTPSQKTSLLLERRRPIITGCLKECGTRDQSCATQCQVCVEMHGCKLLADEECSECLEQVRATVRWSKTVNDGVLDSGGRSQLKDGVRMHLAATKLHVWDAKRHLHRARDGVINAQRQVEWAVEENRRQAERLQESESLLKRKEEEVVKWRTEHAKRLKALHGEVATMRKEQQRTKHHLRQGLRRLRRVQQRLARSEEHKEHWTRLEMAAEQAVKRRRKQCKEQKHDLKLLKERIQQREDDAVWLEKGLRREIREAKELVEKDRRQLQLERDFLCVSRERLEEAKQHYRKAVATTTHEGEVLRKLQKRLDHFALTPPKPWGKGEVPRGKI